MAAKRKTVASLPPQPLILICPAGAPCVRLTATKFAPAGDVAAGEIDAAWLAQSGSCIACGAPILKDACQPVRTAL